MQLSALQEEGKLNILSSPSITTLDNQPASIESGREVPFQTVVYSGNVATPSIEYKKAVLSLKVTPHTIDRNMLRLNIVTHKDELDFSNTVGGNPTIITKNAETNVILYDGQTMVIGGLSKETATDTESGVPFLKDIPLLGRLFKSTGKSSNMEEVLIFITPQILKEKPKP
jgi:type IV pilus assembly protein PilQ